ncbi:hypothetical protein BYT27DRAFT_7213718 [Phlegmacium glaucopus]|nr:hypothetical protein BYT27DRAFT_7213718 [Phlegmacium glaucopus]
MCPGSSNTPRGLCSIEWYTNNPRGTVAEFKVFYDNLQPAELKRYEDLAKENQNVLSEYLFLPHCCGNGPNFLYQMFVLDFLDEVELGNISFHLTHITQLNIWLPVKLKVEGTSNLSTE